MQVRLLIRYGQGPTIEPLIDNGTMIYLCATLRSRGEDELSVGERGAKCLRVGEFGIEKRGPESRGVGSAAVEDDEFLFMVLERWDDEASGVL